MLEKLKSLIKPEHQKILVIGDDIGETSQTWKSEGKEVVIVENLNDNWREVSRDNPDLNLELEKKHFDVLLCFHSLEQVIDPERLLLDLRQYVHSDGFVYIIAYNVGHISTIINLLTEGWAYKDDGALRHNHIRYFSNESLRKLMYQVGFDFIDEVVYQLQQLPILTRQLSQVMKNPYLSILSFIMIGKKVNTFPFIDFDEEESNDKSQEKEKAASEPKAEVNSQEKVE